MSPSTKTSRRTPPKAAARRSSDAIVDNFIAKAKESGDMSSLAKDRETIVELLQTKGAITDRERRVWVQVGCAALYLVGLDTKNATECLTPYVTVDSRLVTLDEAEITQLAERDQLLAGMIITQCANLQYRLAAEFKNGVALAKRADSHFEHVPDDKADGGLALVRARSKNRIWWARLCWRSGDFAEADELLDSALTGLEPKDSPELTNAQRGGIHLILAIGLEIWAAFDWARGRIESAQRKAYQALYLLREGGFVDDAIRRGFALYTVSRVSLSSTVRQYSFARDYAALAQSIFREKGHPFETRATIQLARVAVKEAAQRPDPRSAELLAQAEALLNPIANAKTTDPTREQLYSRAEANLTLVWIASLRAENDAAQWEVCLKRADAIRDDRTKLPSRLEAEGALHFGRALIQRRARTTDVRLGIRHALDALAIARRVSRRKLAVACHLTLAEGYIEDGQQDLALANWNRARSEAADLQSAFLWQWIERLAPRVGGPKTIELNGTYAEALAEFDKLYLTFHEERHDSIEEILATTGLSLSTYYRMRDKANLPRRSKAGRPKGATRESARMAVPSK